MTRTRRKATLAGIGLAGAGGLLALVLAGPNVALADPSPGPSGSASPSASAGAGNGGRSQADREAAREAKENELAEKLAKELGVDQAKVKAALDKIQAEDQAAAKTERLAALKQRLDQAVKDGKLTQAEADAIYKAAENGTLPAGGGPGGGGHRGGR